MKATKVLVIDDEPVVRGAVRRVLEADGLRVESAEDATSGLAHPAVRDCRLVICDLMLPDRSGHEVLAELRVMRPRLPVVLITGFATSDHAARAQEAGAADFLANLYFGTLRTQADEVNVRIGPVAEREAGTMHPDSQATHESELNVHRGRAVNYPRSFGGHVFEWSRGNLVLSHALRPLTFHFSLIRYSAIP